MKQTIVTHIRPDLDACTSVWLIKRFLPNWTDAEVLFVPAGNTYENRPADTDNNVIHVDTGLGKFDHHQFRQRLSASERIFDYLPKIRKFRALDKLALERLVELVTMIDNFEEVKFTEPDSDIYDMGIHQLIEGLKINNNIDSEVMDTALIMVEGLFAILKRKVIAEKDVEEGLEFGTGKIKAIYLVSKSKEASKLAEKRGYKLVLLKDTDSGNINIRVHPLAKFNLDKLYKQIIKLESPDLWFYHSSGHLLLNGSNSHPVKPTKLSHKRLMELIEEFVQKT